MQRQKNLLTSALGLSILLTTSSCIRQAEVSDGNYTLFTNWSLIEQSNTNPQKLWKAANRTEKALLKILSEECPGKPICSLIKQQIAFARLASKQLESVNKSRYRIPTVKYQAIQYDWNGSREAKHPRIAYCLETLKSKDSIQQLKKGIAHLQAAIMPSNANNSLMDRMDQGVCKEFT